MVNILIVDDEIDMEPMIRQRFRRAIQAGKMNLHFARDGVQALQIMDENPEIALVITDINMPRMDGLTLLERLSERVNQTTKTIIVSAYGDLSNIRAGMNRGAFDFVTKPIAFDDLRMTMKRALEKARMERLARDAQIRLLAIEKELELARRVQMGILPRAWPTGGAEELIGFMRSAHEVAGDSYDFIPIDDDHVGFAIADVAGKGMPAAMMAAVTHSLLRALALDTLDPAVCLAKLNTLLTSHNPEMLFITILYCVLDRTTGVVSYASAGHPWPFKLDPKGAVTPLTGQIGIPVGIKDDEVWGTAEVQLNPGDRLFLYSDGLTEATNETVDMFGEERLAARLQALASEASGALIQRLIAEIDEFRGAAPELDDTTCLIVDWRGHENAATQPPRMPKSI